LARLGIITGLISETHCLSGFSEDDGPLVRCDGMGPARATQAARALIAEGCGALVSFGIAGGLDPALVAGTVVLADGVLVPAGGRFPTDTSWRTHFQDLLQGHVATATGAIVGSDVVIEGVAGKRRLHEDTGAVAVDMESHAVALVAKEAGVPFLVLRAISDPAGGTIPPAAMAGVDAKGGSRSWAVLVKLLGRPRDLPALLRLRRDSATAKATLRRVAVIAGPGFGLA
jgi:adenosylhomocysteine nucleosidase